MFATATSSFVEEVDGGGLLIPVSSLNYSIHLLTVVVKRRRFWFWQRPKYLPTDFTLNDILTGDVPIQPVAIETEFINYNGTFGDNIQGAMGVTFVQTNVNLQGKDSSKLQSSFGSMKKEEVSVQNLLQQSKDRVLDMSHCLIQQTKEKQKQVLGIVKERIVTSQPCSVIEEVQQGGQCGAGLTTCGPRSTKFSLKENGSLNKDSNVTMEIPPLTTIAYGLIELEIKHNGHYELCLMSDTTGGFEVDGPAVTGAMRVSDVFQHVSENRHLQEDLEKLNDQFQLLSSLPDTTRSSLLQHFTGVMQDPAGVGALQHVLDQMCLGKTPELGDIAIAESQKENIRAILELMEQCGQTQSALSGQASSVLMALHLISSALDEMRKDCVADLGLCCSHAMLQTMHQLIQCVSGKGELQLSSTDLTALTEDIYEKTAHVFASSNVYLKRVGNTVRTEIHQKAGHLPLVLCIAVRGLASLALCI